LLRKKERKKRRKEREERGFYREKK